MENQKNELAIKLDDQVASVVVAKRLGGFQDAYIVATAVEQLKLMLTPEYMRPIMQLQGNKLGFKTDKDKDGGYPEPVVKNCLIEAVLIGVQPTGNHFNIISGTSYITKEGFGYLLKKQPGLNYTIVPGVPQIDVSNKRAQVKMDVSWTLNGVAKKQTLEIVTKADQWTTSDAVIGKATRKSRCWLFNTINDTEISDADAEEITAEIIDNQENKYDWDDLALLLDLKKEKLTATQLKSSQRIIDNKEETGYKKLQEFLAGI